MPMPQCSPSRTTTAGGLTPSRDEQRRHGAVLRSASCDRPGLPGLPARPRLYGREATVGRTTGRVFGFRSLPIRHLRRLDFACRPIHAASLARPRTALPVVPRVGDCRDARRRGRLEGVGDLSPMWRFARPRSLTCLPHADLSAPCQTNSTAWHFTRVHSAVAIVRLTRK